MPPCTNSEGSCGTQTVSMGEHSGGSALSFGDPGRVALVLVRIYAYMRWSAYINCPQVHHRSSLKLIACAKLRVDGVAGNQAGCMEYGTAHDLVPDARRPFRSDLRSNVCPCLKVLLCLPGALLFFSSSRDHRAF